MPSPRVVARYPAPEAFLAAYDAEVRSGGLQVRDALLDGVAAMSDCTLEVHVEGAAAVEVPARVAAVSASFGVAVLLGSPCPPLDALAARLRGAPAPAVTGAPDAARGTVADRVRTHSTQQKIQLALSGGREERMALLRDVNRAVHAHVLRNPRATLEEAQWAARATTVSPDVYALIAEHPDWGRNAVVAAALARNPKVPMPVVARMLDRVSASELRAIAKGGARPEVVQAARRKLGV